MGDEKKRDSCGKSVSDEEIISLFFSRSEDAVIKTEKKYGKLFRRISSNILSDMRDVAECVNDAYMKLWDTIPPEKPSNLKAYGARIVRNLSLNRAEYNSAAKRGGYDLILSELEESVPAPAADTEETRELASCIDSFLRSCDSESRVIFVRRYWYCDSVEIIAHSLGFSESKVKSKLFRTRKKLKSYLEKEGVSL